MAVNSEQLYLRMETLVS